MAIFTSVVMRGEGQEVLHTTRIDLLGMPSLLTTEVISLADNGVGFVLRSKQRYAPTWLQRLDEGPGEVAADSQGAIYHLHLFGAEMLQRTRQVPGGLELVQETAWSRASTTLHPVPGPRWRGRSDSPPRGASGPVPPDQVELKRSPDGDDGR